MSAPRLSLTCALALGVALTAQRAGAQDDPPPGPRVSAGGTPTFADIPRPTLVWEWQTFQPWEYGATGAFAALSVLPLIVPIDEGRWTAKNELDSSVRDALRPETRLGRRRAGDASDVLVAVGINHLLFDTMVVAWNVHGRGSVAWQMLLIDVETMAFARALTSIVKTAVGRERPYVEDCATDPELANLDECQGSDRFRSFFSGHTSTAFATAGLTCIHHANLPLYGGGIGDGLACAGSLATASAVGVLRIMADDHNATDVLAGALVGAASGIGLPWLLHYRLPQADVGDAAAGAGMSIRLVPAPTGGAIVGEF